MQLDNAFMAAAPKPLESLQVDLAALGRKNLTALTIATELPLDWLKDALAGTDAIVEAPGYANLELQLQSGGIAIVRGRVDLAFAVPCARCLELAQCTSHESLFATFLPAAEATRRSAVARADDEGLALEPDDLETLAYEGTTLDLGPLVAEQVALAYPMRVLCARGQDCRGLCSQCGASMNELPADASRCSCGRAVAPGWGPDPTDPTVGPGPADPDGAPTPWQQALRKLRSS